MYSFSLCWILQTAQHFVLVLCPVISKDRTGLFYLANKIAPYRKVGTYKTLSKVRDPSLSVVSIFQYFPIFVYFLCISYLYIPTYPFIYLCMYVRCTCMYVSVSISIHSCWLIHLYISACMYIHIYIYLLPYVCIYIFHTHSHCIFLLLWTKDISLSPHQLSCSSCWGISLFNPPALMLLILPNGPWEDTEREVEGSAAALPSGLLCLLLPLSSFAMLCCHACFLQDIAPIFLWYLPSIVFVLKDLPSFPPTSAVLPFLPREEPWSLSILPARVRLDFCLAVLQKLLSLGLSVFSGFSTPMVSFQITWPTPHKLHLLAFLLLSKAFFFILFNWLIFCCPFLRDQKALLPHPLFSYFIHFRVSPCFTVLSFRIFRPCHINCASPPCPTGTSKFLWPRQNVLTVEYCCCYCCLVTKSCLTLMTPWIAASQAPVSMGFPRQEYWSGLPFPSPGDLQGISRGLGLHFLHWQVNSLSLSHQGSIILPLKRKELWHLL